MQAVHRRGERMLGAVKIAAVVKLPIADVVKLVDTPS